MDASIVAAFSQAAKDTFRDMFSLEARRRALRELKPSEGHGWDLSGLVGLAGQAQGVVAIRLNQVPRRGAARGLRRRRRGAESERVQLESGLVGEMTKSSPGPPSRLSAASISR